MKKRSPGIVCLMTFAFCSLFSAQNGTSFNTAVNYTVNSNPSSLAIGDLNNDGINDIIAASNHSVGTVSMLFAKSGGGFSPSVTRSAGQNYPNYVAIGDLNGDGKNDFLTSGNNGTYNAVTVGFSNTANNFNLAFFGAGSYINSVAIGDLNNDGTNDIAVTNQSHNTVSVLLANGIGGFITKVAYAVGNTPECVAIGDLNNDGKKDLVTANRFGNNVSVLFANNSGSYDPQVTYNVGTNPYSVAIGDLNGDGKNDIVTANNSSGTVSVLLADGNGGFSPQITYSVGNNPICVAIGDLNIDGKNDIAVANYGSKNVSVLLADSNGSFASQATYATGGNNPISVAVGDLNGDGTNDIATANYGSDNVSVLTYKVENLSANNAELTDILIYKKDHNIIINSKHSKILSLEIYDSSGKKVYTNSRMKINYIDLPAEIFGKQILLLKIITEKGIITNKIANY